MRVGVIAAAEPLAIDGIGNRSFRAGMVTSALVGRGHEVTWWTSNFDHVRKAYRFPPIATVDVQQDGYLIRLLNGRPYKRNISLARLRHNREVAEALGLDMSSFVEKLDLIFCCVPTQELAAVAVAVGRRKGIPVVLDVRDPWPDVYLSVLPHSLRRAAKVVLSRQFESAKENFRRADALTAVSETYLEWGLALAGRSKSRRDEVFPIGHPNAPSVRAPRPEGGPFVCTFVGTFGASYDLETLISAARLLEQTSDRPFLIRLVGDGDNKAHLASLAAGVRTVELTGWLGAERLQGVLATSSVGLCAYRRDAVQTLPNKPFEYWSAGLPIANSLTGELAQLIDAEGVGINYQPGDAAGLAGVLMAMERDAGRVDAMSQRASRLMEHRFSAQRIYDDMVTFLEEVGVAVAPQ